MMQVTQGKFPETVTSIKENTASIKRSHIESNLGEGEEDRVVGKLVDIPGHASMRMYY